MAKVAISDARLTALWNRRGALSLAESGELYGIVNAVLLTSRAALFEGLDDEREDYIHTFFIQKVLSAPADAVVDRNVSGNHLRGFFKNFLNDQRDKQKRRSVQLISEPATDEDGEEFAPDYEDSRRFDFSPDGVEETLAQNQLTRRQLTESAQAFFNALQGWQQQVLSRHLCAEAEYAVPLSQLQEQYPKTATYHKVKQLGIVHSLRNLPIEYEKTNIGRWLTKQLQLKLEPDNYAMLQIALQVLCVVALHDLDA